jgi:hypothetical protein
MQTSINYQTHKTEENDRGSESLSMHKICCPGNVNNNGASALYRYRSRGHRSLYALSHMWTRTKNSREKGRKETETVEVVCGLGFHDVSI